MPECLSFLVGAVCQETDLGLVVVRDVSHVTVSMKAEVSGWFVHGACVADSLVALQH